MPCLKDKRIKEGAVLVINEHHPDAALLYGECVLVKATYPDSIFPILATSRIIYGGGEIAEYLYEHEVEYVCDL